MNDQMTFGRIVRRYMAERKMTADMLAASVGVSKRCIQYILADKWNFEKAQGMIGLRIVRKLRIPVSKLPHVDRS